MSIFRHINLGHFKRATQYSIAGLKYAAKTEQAFKHEIIVLGVLVLLLFITGKSFGQFVLVIFAWFIVMAIELLNSAIEQAFNMINLDYDERIKNGKDMASASIFLAIAANVGLWLHVFIFA